MCEFLNEFLLCSCIGDDANDDQIDWILRRRDENRKSKVPLPIELGQRFLSNDFSDFNSIEYIRKKEEIAKIISSLSNETQNQLNLEKFQTITTDILFQLNNKNCFDKKIELMDKDVLSIRLDKDLKLWLDLIYRKLSWKIAKFSLDESKYLEIINGKIKTNR